jgi:methanogenic corrinoid protein MtbC1
MNRKELQMSTDLLDELQKAIVTCAVEDASRLTARIVREGIDPLEALDRMTLGVRQVGDGFNKGELWLPDLIRASEAFQAALPILMEELTRSGKERKYSGVVVIGTVFGDIHNIGKDMVATLLLADGFAVHDLGINVTAERFIAAIKEHHADLLAMSALLSISAQEQKKVIANIEREGLRDSVKVMVGGGAISQEFADSIGADGYAATAPLATALARTLLDKQIKEGKNAPQGVCP